MFIDLAKIKAQSDWDFRKRTFRIFFSICESFVQYLHLSFVTNTSITNANSSQVL